MLKLQLRAVPEGADEYATVASMLVDENGVVARDDPDHRIPDDMPVLVFSEGEPPRRVTLDEDPIAWVTNLHRLLRTGYLVPVVEDCDG